MLNEQRNRQGSSRIAQLSYRIHVGAGLLLLLGCRSGNPSRPAPQAWGNCKPITGTLEGVTVLIEAALGADYMVPNKFSAAIRLTAVGQSPWPAAFRADSAWFIVDSFAIPLALWRKEEQSPDSLTNNPQIRVAEEYPRDALADSVLQSMRSRRLASVKVQVRSSSGQTELVARDCRLSISM